MDEIPLWELKRMFKQLGVRLPPKAKQAKPAPPMSNVLPMHYQKKEDDNEIPKGNLDTPEYRYFYGEPEGWSRVSRCRACHTVVVMGEMGRKLHLREGIPGQVEKCTVRMNRALKRLLAQKKCVVCRQTSKESKWGTPFCGRTLCYKVWMFRANVSVPLLEEALK